MKSSLDLIKDWEMLAKKSGYSARKAAALCKVSLRQLERYCQQNFQYEPHTWFKEMRVRRAQALLAEGMTVKETSINLMFKQTSHFCREFKRHTGITPGDFAFDQKRRRQEDVAVEQHMS